MAKQERYWIAKRDMTMGGQQVSKGQLIKPTAAPNDHILFGDNTRWTARFDGSPNDARLCDTDGCTALFADDGLLARHRLLIHAPERDARERSRIQAVKDAAERELQPDSEIVPGETTIGGHLVTEVKKGPRGPVPYVQM